MHHPDAVWTRPDGASLEDHDWAGADCVGLTLAAVEGGGRVHLIFNRGGQTPGRLPAGAAWRLALDSARGFVGEEPAGDAFVAPARSVLAFVEA